MTTNKLRALITGITGQDGQCLTKLLLSKGYEVHGFARRGSSVKLPVQGLHFGDLTDPAALRFALNESDPHEVYNLGAQSHVKASFVEPEYTFSATARPIITVLEWAREHRNVAMPRKIYHASSSEMFGDSLPPQDEETPFRPRSPYAIAKVAAHQSVRLWREAYGVFAVAGILFNHEEPGLRPPAFVTRKISLGVARIFANHSNELVLGNLEAKRDWGLASDFVKAQWLMRQQDEPRDYVIATGEAHTVREFVEFAFLTARNATGRNLQWEDYVRLDKRFERPAEVPFLLGDSTRAR
ncbi:MAG: GDP-mannose 4,6-dehydratase, partial [Acidobacteria bacterium]